MSRRAKQGISVGLVLACVALGIGIYALIAGRGAVTAQTMPDVGRFRAGSELGAERAGFSGRAMVQVFTSAAAADWHAIAACLQDPAVTALMDPQFVGVLVDETLEPTVEEVLRARDKLAVVVRGLNGAFLGGLPAGFTCTELLELLKSLRQRLFFEPEKSPIYANLLERPEVVVDAMVASGDLVKAAKFVAFLEELEGAASPAVVAAKARLWQ
ncbi:MAG: hypothetical protein HY721_22505 [Planctomycetes bacterium]|nr:hypothetical protein [Planctomycetota bacterium]